MTTVETPVAQEVVDQQVENPAGDASENVNLYDDVVVDGLEPLTEATDEPASPADEPKPAEPKAEEKPAFDKEANNLRQEMANLRKLIAAQNKPTESTPAPAPSAVRQQIAKIIEGVKASGEGEITPAMAKALEELATMMGNTLEKYEQDNTATQQLVAERKAAEEADQYWASKSEELKDLPDARKRFESHAKSYLEEYPTATPDEASRYATRIWKRENEIIRARAKLPKPASKPSNASIPARTAGPKTQSSHKNPMADIYDVPPESMRPV